MRFFTANAIAYRDPLSRRGREVSRLLRGGRGSLTFLAPDWFPSVTLRYGCGARFRGLTQRSIALPCPAVRTFGAVRAVDRQAWLASTRRKHGLRSPKMNSPGVQRSSRYYVAGPVASVCRYGVRQPCCRLAVERSHAPRPEHPCRLAVQILRARVVRPFACCGTLPTPLVGAQTGRTRFFLSCYSQRDSMKRIFSSKPSLLSIFWMVFFRS